MPKPHSEELPLTQKMKAIIRFIVKLVEDQGEGKESKLLAKIVLEKEVSTPVLPEKGVRIDGFEIFDKFESLLQDDLRHCREEDHGQVVDMVEFELRGGTLTPIIWIWDEYDRTDDSENWENLDAEKAFKKFFRPQCDKYGFRVVRVSFGEN